MASNINQSSSPMRILRKNLAKKRKPTKIVERAVTTLAFTSDEPVEFALIYSGGKLDISIVKTVAELYA